MEGALYARQGQDHQTQWLQPVIKKARFVHWEIDDGFWHWHLTNRANNTSTRSFKYTSSSATFLKTKIRLPKSLNREATLAETFKYTYTLKENKETFADQRSQDHYIYESYTQRLEAATQQSQQGGEDATNGSTAAVVDPDAV
ncbi:hypothetical protein Ahy_A05g025560 [Arachis hypogaea]|uniref:Uncharacterized protein n=1 Tax=Arachis hypogaea TaxID=3818 RepID=A0A445D905_ARAHY|nr:hypothetical protein Ahy_A05g025560 [Arachis hypogaea]